MATIETTNLFPSDLFAMARCATGGIEVPEDAADEVPVNAFHAEMAAAGFRNRFHHGDVPAQRNWWVLYSKSRQEKALARQLLGQGVPHYLPLVVKRTIHRGRKFSSAVPLFAGYVFMFGSEEERVTSLTTNRISRILPVGDGAGLCHDLEQIQRLIAAGAPITVEQRLAPGRRVRIRSGALLGLEGTVLARQGPTRLFVAVNFLKQGASIEIEDCLLEPID